VFAQGAAKRKIVELGHELDDLLSNPFRTGAELLV
jgi:hypothetical protein